MTTAKTTKPTCVLLDANIVIKAHQLEIWLALIEKIKVMVPSIVVHDEALFSSRATGDIPKNINLLQLTQNGKITKLTATAEELAKLQAMFDPVFGPELHAGEVEALALLQEDKAQGAYFCTSDRCAIQALAMIGMSGQGISMETLLRSVGLQKPLPGQYREDFFKKNLKQGQQNRITGEGLARNG